MNKSHFLGEPVTSSSAREERIRRILHEHREGSGAAELCRKYDISDTTFYKWRSRYSNDPDHGRLGRDDKN